MLLVVVGCAQFDAQPIATDAARGPDGASAGDASAGCTLGPWSAPRHLAGVNTSADEGGPALSADKLTLYFESSRAGGLDLYRATRDSTQADFGSVTALAQLNTSFDDNDPTLSADELTMYFASDRLGSGRLYRATRASTAQEFTAPAPVDELTFAIAGPSLRADGNELFFSDWSASVLGTAMYASGQGFAPVGPITVLDSGYANSSPSLSSDGLTLYYQHKEGFFDPFRIYTATRPDLQSAFGSPTPVTAFDDANDTGNPEISRDGRTMVVASNRSGGNGGYDLYIAERSCE